MINLLFYLNMLNTMSIIYICALQAYMFQLKKLFSMCINLSFAFHFLQFLLVPLNTNFNAFFRCQRKLHCVIKLKCINIFISKSFLELNLFKNYTITKINNH